MLQRILVATNLFGRGMDIERVNIVFNYDMPEDSDTYLHRVARAGRFGTKVRLLCFVIFYFQVLIQLVLIRYFYKTRLILKQPKSLSFYYRIYLSYYYKLNIRAKMCAKYL